jgi:nitrite reductase/ring-hydroxylating ferredoxin subunit
MNRKQFMVTCGKACVASLYLSPFLQSCGTAKIVQAKIEGSDLLVPLSDFELVHTDIKTFKKYVVVQNSSLQYPICIFRADPERYSALLLRCPHQGVELQAFGDTLHCPAHGSEFTNEGLVTAGPATENLRIFNTRIENGLLKISLK